MSRSLRRLRLADRLLAEVEREIALISRCRPRNAEAEQLRLVDSWSRGEPQLPRWSYHRVPEFSPWRRAMAEALTDLSEAEPLERLYLERAEELQLETRVVEAVGTRQLRQAASRRFAFCVPGEETSAAELVDSWLRLDPSDDSPRIMSDDVAHPQSLYTSMRRAVGQLRLPVRVELSDRLTAAAATGDRLILIARGRPLSTNDVRRIVLHEVLGHAFPRHRATQQPLGLYAVGSRWGNDEQEGYALFLERRSGVMDDARRVELARRHHAAIAVREGADWIETTRALMQLGADLAVAAAIASRVHRAGGLAREIVYLPAFLRVRAAIDADPDVEDWLGRGRLSLHAVGVLRHHHPSGVELSVSAS